MRFMVDTQVLIYSTTRTTAKSDPDHIKMVRAAKALIQPLTRIRVSSIVAAEYVPFAGNDALWSRFEIEAFDTGQAFFASQLCKQLRQSPALCPKCLNPKRQPKSCGACKHHADRRGKEQDLRVAAAAECSGTAALYTFDRWLLDVVAPYLKKCAIRKPPNPDGPLFDHNADDSDAGDGKVIKLNQAG